MTRFLSTACFLFVVTSLCWGAEAVPDGTWKWSSEMNEQTINSVLHLHSSDGELTGVYKDQNIEKDIENAKLDEGKVSFELNVDVNDTVVNIKFNGEVKDSAIDGMVGFYVDGQQQGEDYPWNPKRHVGNAEVVGNWDFRFQAPDGEEYTPTLTIAEEKGRLVGYITSGADTNDEETVSVELDLEDNQLTFSYVIQLDGDLELTYICRPRGNKLTGTLQYKGEESEGEFDVAATKNELAPGLKRLLGKWQFVTTGDDGVERKPVLTLAEKDGELDATLTDDDKEFDLENVRYENGKVAFDFINEHDGIAVNISWSCHPVGGDRMAGELEYDADGNTGEIELKGERLD